MDVLLGFFQNTGHFVLNYLLPFIIVLGIMVFIHELGHFVVAKLFDVKVLKFALGFGPKIVSRDWGETEYSVRYVPLGGFVKMLGENEDIEEDETITEEDIPRGHQPLLRGRGLSYVPGRPLQACAGTGSGRARRNSWRPGIPTAPDRAGTLSATSTRCDDSSPQRCSGRKRPSVPTRPGYGR